MSTIDIDDQTDLFKQTQSLAFLTLKCCFSQKHKKQTFWQKVYKTII